MSAGGLEPFADAMLAMCRAQFPRSCGNCKREFRDFKDFVAVTEPIGDLLDPTEDIGDPVGLLSFSNCPCGSTLALRCEDPEQHRRFVAALRAETRSSGRSAGELLRGLRARIRALALESR